MPLLGPTGSIAYRTPDMSAYKCLSCGVSERRVPAREAELIRGGWLNLCATCARDNLAEQVAEITHSIVLLLEANGLI